MSNIAWSSTPDPSDEYTPEQHRQLDAHLAYPGANPLSPRSGISPSGGVAATISGSTVSVRDMTGVFSPSGAPWSSTGGGYRFVLYAQDLVVGPPDASLVRTDVLVARISDDDIDSSGVRVATAEIIVGTPGSGEPAIQANDLKLSIITVPPGGPNSIAPAGLYSAALGGILTVPSADRLPTEGLYGGMAAYAQTQQALYLVHGGSWEVAASRRGYQWGGSVRFTSSGSFVKDNYPGLRAVKVKVQAGGGAGGGAMATVGGASTGTASNSGGGGGGCYAEAVILASSLGASVTVTVGAGGASSAGNSGSDGGTSSFGSFVSCPGGRGGFNRSASTGHSASSGGSESNDATIAGHIPGTEMVVRGGGGSNGYSFGNSVVHYSTEDKGAYGQGGTSFLGGTSRGARGPSTDARPGAPYGGGGSGTVCGWDDTSGEAAKAGGAGATGIVIVELMY